MTILTKFMPRLILPVLLPVLLGNSLLVVAETKSVKAAPSKTEAAQLTNKANISSEQNIDEDCNPQSRDCDNRNRGARTRADTADRDRYSEGHDRH